MFSLICNYLYDKLFYKPTQGRKRKSDESTEYPPLKQMRIDSTSNFNTENSYIFQSTMQNKESLCELSDDCSITNELYTKKWPSSHLMARQPIHGNKYKLNCPAPLDKRKMEGRNSGSVKQSSFQSSNMREIEVVKYVTKDSSQNSGQMSKKKQTSSRIFNSFQSNSRQNSNSNLKPMFQANVKKSLNFMQESYRLSEKVQYMQLLQQQTLKLNSMLAPFTIQKIGSQKERKPSIPVIDLTKEKSSVTVNRTRESVPWTSSKASSDLSLEWSSPDAKEVPKINTLQDMLKTHSVTDTNVVDQILTKHATATAEKKRQAEIEAAKLKVLSESNRKSLNDLLEERLQHYMHITTPAIEEIEVTKEKYVLPDLSKEQELKISSILVPTPAGEVLVEKFGLQIKRRDLQTLKGLNWLNDEVINFYMNLIMERGKTEKLPNVYAFNTFFYPKLISTGHGSLKRWTKKVDIFSHDLILVPIHLGMHWCMSVIDFRSKEVRYYDSMGSSNNRCLNALLSYLEAESLDKKKVAYSTNDWKQINVDDIPQQMNGSDCGVFSCVFAEHLARNSPLLFSQENMPYFRRKMALEIVEAKLLT
ncbi:hypothetical protein RUM43_009924 [Polyplax serrata]|uniref:Ubiquitin-like protease family profile domain-containing protein n=1 Tax=Polyplax serrata TaxID=468196 RepID=A0AAN8S9W2_POLSC